MSDFPLIYLRFPPKELSPNARIYWAKAAKIKKLYRYECYIEAVKQGVVKIKTPKRLNVALIFYPPDKRRRDWDNMLAAIKSGLDGLSDAIGVDDRHWDLSFTVSDETKNMVSVEIKETLA